jgi:hypothetical protein
MTTDCKHPRIQTWRFEDSAEVAGLWSCADCGRRFEPVAVAPVSQGLTPADRFEDAIREVGIVFACEWFGHASGSEFTQETIRVLSERADMKDKP